MTATDARPLTAEQVRRFLADGYLELQPGSVSDADNEALYRGAGELYELARASDSSTAHLDVLGDNLRARFPSLDRVLHDPVVDGALTSLLGADYLIHPHSYCHRSSGRDQIFHQDGNLPWNERGHVRSHRCDWLMVFYYPQAVDELNGPTEVVAGSQYWTVDHETADGGWRSGDRLGRTVDDEVFAGPDLAARDRALDRALAEGLGLDDLDRRFLLVPAGTVLIAHYDLIHRGSRSAGGDERYLYKFYCARVHEPAASARPAIVPGHDTVDRAAVPAELQPRIAPVVASMARWLGVPASRDPADIGPSSDHPPAGAEARDPAGGDVEAELEAALVDGREDERVASAYRLGDRAAGGSEAALEALRSALEAPTEGARRAAGHGLRQAGSSGVPVLLAGLEALSPSARRVAAAGLGTAAAAAVPEVVERLCAATRSDTDTLVRSNAVYSLGQLSRSLPPSHEPGDREPVDAIAAALLARLAPGEEPDNAHNAGFSRSTVRQSAAFALAVLLANHRLAERHLATIVDGPLRDTDRYVQGLVVEGLARCGSLPPDLARRFVAFLTSRRWTPAVGTTQPLDRDRLVVAQDSKWGNTTSPA